MVEEPEWREKIDSFGVCICGKSISWIRDFKHIIWLNVVLLGVSLAAGRGCLFVRSLAGGRGR